MDRGEVLYAARRRKHMSQEHLAAISEVSVRTIRRAERGEDVSGESLRCLCAVLEIEAGSLPDAVPDSPDAIRQDREAEARTVTVMDAPAPHEVNPAPGRAFGLARFLATAGSLPVTAIALAQLAGAWPSGSMPAALLALAQCIPGCAHQALTRRMDMPSVNVLLGFAGTYIAVLWLIFFGAGKPGAVLVAELVVLLAGTAQVGFGIRARHREVEARARGRASA